jgi:hypothetical protein
MPPLFVRYDVMAVLGRVLITLGIVLVAAGALILIGQKLPFLRIGRLPGDIYIRGNPSFYFPLTTCILLSAFLTFVTWLFRR